MVRVKKHSHKTKSYIHGLRKFTLFIYQKQIPIIKLKMNIAAQLFNKKTFL